MKTSQNRISGFPPNVETNFGGGKVCKRPAYSTAYILLTFAYMPAYPAAYLPFTGRAGGDANNTKRLVLWVNNSVRYRASCWVFKNRYKGFLQ
jgi:hypothetical protein